LFGHAFVYSLFLIVGIVGVVTNSLLVSGPYPRNGIRSIWFTYPGLDRLPWWVKYVIGLAWLFALLCVTATAVYFATHGQVHNGRYYDGSGQSHPATDFEVGREYTWVILGFSGFSMPALIYPALLFFFERRLADE
jgi:hypothetical protein